MASNGCSSQPNVLIMTARADSCKDLEIPVGQLFYSFDPLPLLRLTAIAAKISQLAGYYDSQKLVRDAR